MSIKWIEISLREILRTFGRILDDMAPSVIYEAIAELKESKEKFETQSRQTHHPGRNPEPWGYSIDSRRPLRFKESSAKGAKGCWADLCGFVHWADDPVPIRQSIHLRLWSRDPDLVLREDWDSEDVFARIAKDGGGARVLLRCHSDRANPDQQGPLYHLQFGGGAGDAEVCWHPSSIRLPRLAYPPMDLVLACQMVAANLYWSDYSDRRDWPEWRGAVLESQRHLLSRYYECCYRCVTKGEPLDSVPSCVGEFRVRVGTQPADAWPGSPPVATFWAATLEPVNPQTHKASR